MARITVEDCLEVVNNRFELVMMASKRARQLANGVQATLDNSETEDKPTVLALREIAARKIDNALIVASIPPQYNSMVVGTILICAVAVDHIRRQRLYRQRR